MTNPIFHHSHSMILCAAAIAAAIAFQFIPDVAWWLFGLLSVAGLVLIGIPHGALDVLTHNSRGQSKNTARFIIAYVIGIGLVLLGWLFLPTISLIAFLLLSAWHFGQADFELWQIRKANIAWGGMAWGILLLSFILGWHLTEVSSILATVGIPGGHLERAVGLEKSIQIATATGWIVALAYALRLRCKAWIWSLLMFVCLPFMPVLIAFMFFFVGQHSYAGWLHLKRGLNLDHVQLWRKAAPFHFGAWAIIVAGVYSLGFNETLSHHATVGWFFALLGSISIPHIIESHFFIQSIKNGNQS
jgi:Brp/Blh family beta-carotene 15,15'-monooxygenase